MAERRADLPPARSAPARVLLALVAVVLLLVPASPAGAVDGQVAPSPRAQPAAGIFELRSFDPWHEPDKPFTIGLEVQTAVPATLEVTATVFRAVTSRSEFNQTLEGRMLTRVAAQAPAVSVADLPLDLDGQRSFSFSPALSGEGVYPVRVELRPKGGGTRINSFVTYLVHVPGATDAAPLDVGLVLPVHSDPALAPDGTVAIDEQRGQELAEMATSLNRRPDVPLTLSPTPETLEAMATDGDDADRSTLAAFVAAARNRQVLGGPYVDVDASAMVDAGLDGEANAQLTRGASVLGALLDTQPASTVRLVERPLSDGGLASLQSEPQPVDRIVVPEALLEPMFTNTTLTETFELESRKGRVLTAMADDGMAAHFEGTEPVLAASQLLADLAVVYFDRPGTPPRGVVVAPPPGLAVPGAFLDAVLDGLADSPVLEPVTLERFFAEVPMATTTTRRGEPPVTLLRRFAVPAPEAVSAALPTAAVLNTRRRVVAFASAIDQPNPVLDRMERTLLVATGVDVPPADRSRYLESAMRQVADELKGIAMPQDRSITLTARQGEIPFTVTSRLGYPIRAVLRVGSDTLEFPEGAERPLDLVRRNTTTQITVRAQSSGSFPLRVRLESPDGLVLAESRFTVRSTAVSGVGTLLSAGALLFLLVWWGRHLRGRRSRRLVPAG